MNFGELEEDIYQNDLGYTRGNIGKGGIGAGIRMAQIDERTRIRASQTLKKNLQKEQATYGGATTVKKQISGTASSVAFTPYQGLEIVNPQASAEKRAEEANAKYFSSSGAFMKVKTPLPGSLPWWKEMKNKTLKSIIQFYLIFLKIGNMESTYIQILRGEAFTCLRQFLTYRAVTITLAIILGLKS